MGAWGWTVVGLGALVLAGAIPAWWWWRRHAAMHGFERARRLFHWRREWLEADLITLASRAHQSHGIQWADCEFDDEAVFATERRTGQLRALVGLVVRLKTADVRSATDDALAAGLQLATAVFQFDGRQWSTDGRLLLNLSPLEAIERFQHELEMVD